MCVYKLKDDIWQGKKGTKFILSRDDGSKSPFFKRLDGEKIINGESVYEYVSIFWEDLEEMKNALDELTRFQTDRGLHERPFNLDALAKNVQEEVIELAVDTVLCNADGQVDALADIAVFALGDIMKLGYDPEKVLLEVSKEINSRVGTFVDGKFMKDKSEEAMKNWYKADFTGCKLD